MSYSDQVQESGRQRVDQHDPKAELALSGEKEYKD